MLVAPSALPRFLLDRETMTMRHAAPTLLAMAALGLPGGAIAAGDPTQPALRADEFAAPEIEATTWFNHIGQPLSLAALRGRPILVEVWATW